MSAVVPELLVRDLAESRLFWCDLLGFQTAYERAEVKFVFLRQHDAAFMLEELGGSERQWLSAELQPPFGRGINFQIELPEIEAALARINKAGWPIYLPLEEKTYRVGDEYKSQIQFAVQDPDGYLLRLVKVLQ